MGKYHKGIRIEGAEEFLLAVNITGHGAPTEDTEAEPGMCYLDEDSEHGDLYKCIGVLVTETRTVYRWKKLAGQEEVERLSEAIAEKTGGSKVYYAVCETHGESNPKMAYTVTNDFVLERGARVGVWFKYNNLGAQNLNVDETGVFQWISARKSDGTIVSDTPTTYKAGGQLLWFTFDGEYWIVDDSIRAGEDTVGKVSLSQIRTEAAKNHYTKTEIDNKFSALDTALAEAIGSGVVS